MTEKNYQKFFYDTYCKFKNLDQAKQDPKLVRKEFERYFAAFLPKDKNINILEIGCGSGYFLDWLKSKAYQNLTGIDLDQNHIDFAKSLGLNNVICDDGINFLKNYQGQKFDLIFAIDLIEHLDRNQVIEFFEVINSNLNPGGLIIIRTPNAESPFFGSYQFGDLTHETAYNRFSLRQIAKAFDFKKVDFKECHQRHCPQFKLSPYVIKEYIRYKTYLLSWGFIKKYLLLDQNAICTKNIIAVFQK